MQTTKDQVYPTLPPAYLNHQEQSYLPSSPPAMPQQMYQTVEPNSGAPGYTHYPSPPPAPGVPPPKEHYNRDQENGQVNGPGRSGGLLNKVNGWSLRKKIIVIASILLALMFIIGLGAGLGSRRHHKKGASYGHSDKSSSSSDDSSTASDDSGGPEYGSAEYCSLHVADCNACWDANQVYCMECLAADTC